MQYHVVFRVCERLAAVNKMPRPFALDKRQIIALAFQSLLSSLKEASVNYEIHVVEDGISDELRQILAAEASAIHATQGSGVVPSLAKSFELGASFADDDWVYFCEDDYLHRVECISYIDDLLRSAPGYLAPFHQMDLYIHPCDSPDRYRRPDLYTGEVDDGYKIFCSQHCHWRAIPSTTHTWLTQAESFKKNLALFHENLLHHAHYGASDHYLGQTLYNRDDVLCLSPIPGLSSHLHEGTMSPVVDWQAIRDQYKSLL